MIQDIVGGNRDGDSEEREEEMDGRLREKLNKFRCAKMIVLG
jgi:hypothetical protein